jgi:biotin carboxylase
MPVVVFVSPYFSENAKRFLSAVASLPDVKLGVVSEDPLDRLDASVRERLAGHTQVADALSTDQIVEASRTLATRLGPIDRLLGVVEQVQVQLGEARETLGIAGMRAEQARNFRDKARMKDLLRDAGLPCARHRLVASERGAREFAEQVGYPLVLKPVAGAAAQATFRVDGPESLAAALTAAPPNADAPVMCEEFVTGVEHSFDAFVLDGRVLFHTVTRYSPTPMEVMSTPWIQWTVVLPREVDAPEFDDIRAAGTRALDTLGLGTGMCHLEWFRRRNGSLAISEVAARPPGAQFTTLISRANDFDSLAEYARLMVFGQFVAPTERRYAAGAAFLRGQGQGRVKAVHGLDDAQREVGHLITDARVPDIGQEKGSSYEGEGYVILRHPETSVVEQALQRVISLIRVELA